MASPRVLGRQAESVALEFLRRRGLRCLWRNFNTRLGEIDLIMEDAGDIVFVEVRQRATKRFGGALESVTAAKRHRVIAAARYYLLIHAPNAACRFDVVALDGRGRVEWIRDAFQVTVRIDPWHHRGTECTEITDVCRSIVSSGPRHGT